MCILGILLTNNELTYALGIVSSLSLILHCSYVPVFICNVCPCFNLSELKEPVVCGF